jgi:ATP-dependent Clp protease ATP-binding subunit ClpC
MTSNLGTKDLRKSALGFGMTDSEVTYEAMKERVTDDLKKNFRPEFLNRIDEVIVFRELSREDVRNIVDMLFKRVTEQLRSQDIEVELTKAVKDYLAQEGYDPTLGARPLRRAIQRLIEDPLSEKILWKEFHAGHKITVDAEPDPEDPGKIGIKFTTSESDLAPEVELAGTTPSE